MEPAQSNTKKKVIAGLVIVVVIALLAIGEKALTAKDDAPQNTAQVSSDATATSDSSGAGDAADPAGDPSSSSSSYKDGIYTATGTYTSPGGNESVGVSVTLKDGVITDSSVQEGAGDPEAREYQEDFISAYKSFVTGKDIDSIQLSRVSGSSLTSNGFNRALDHIKEQAKA